MLNSKSSLRKELLALREEVSPCNLTLAQLNAYPEFISAKVVFCYVSAHGEVWTHNLIKELLKIKEVVVPYCTDKEGSMICVKIKSFDDLKVGSFKILEPRGPLAFPKEKIDFAIVPAIAFDADGFRLGYGKGYYDRFLSDISPFKLGVCQKEFFLDLLPHDKYDIKMDSVLKL